MTPSANSIFPRLSLQANVWWTLVGNVVYSACQWGMLVALAKLSSAETVGQFALGLAVTAPVMMLASLQLREAEASDARQEYSFEQYLALRLLTTVLALLVVAAIVMVAGYDLDTASIILAVAAAKGFESVSDVFHGLFQQRERMDLVAKSLLAKGPLSLVVLGVGVHLTGSLLWATVGLATSWALVLLAYDVRNGRRLLHALRRSGSMPPKSGEPRSPLRLHGQLRTLARLAWLTLPLGFAGLLSSLDTNLPRYFIEPAFGTSLLGIFAALAYFDRAGTLVVYAVGRAAIPRLSQYYVERNAPAFGALLRRLAGIGIALGTISTLIASTAGSYILTLLYRPEYARQDVFVVLMVGAGLGYIGAFLMCAPTAARRFGVQLLLHACGSVVLVLCCGVLVPWMGLLGAALALLITKGGETAGALAIALHTRTALRE